MNKLALSLVSLAMFAAFGCAAPPDDSRPAPVGEAALAVERPALCAATAECGGAGHCSTDDGPCVACDSAAGCVCSGVCTATAGEHMPVQCGASVCGARGTCCTGDCSACVPGGDSPSDDVIPTDLLSCIVWCQNQGVLGDATCLDLCSTRFPD